MFSNDPHKAIQGELWIILMDDQHRANAIITNVKDDSPADRAGLKVGDHVVGING